ncbi:uncharacterized protein RCC_08416 [Ramularia collo-cygni]|uniref:Uncharacterized protein n=1 Tax=Ramularia collo-cygni TaxID=112498 RepID=A0A2D3VF67_9PEZI|nr:uncharacterized protein RCC_08416 [Ramularia collo-cygni]CZT22711.1 uncharacterized protein RCC_08416 [Ramularia collo-cygni]
MGATELPDHQHSDHLSIEDREHGSDGSVSHEKGNTTRDEVEMSRMGKKQELRASGVFSIHSPISPLTSSQRTFKFVSIVGFVTILQATWENVLLANWFGLYNGGTAGVIWCTIAVWLLMLCMIASL